MALFLKNHSYCLCCNEVEPFIILIGIKESALN
ncbi:hypothetical protein CPS_0932 [Colwellia psychrerythraea 34H]|uniref:Uncharacterized protein n=1 Tax=Colwellia psychrerythraea (strain 34H / ATCC BAA-681) TaxID=167879 RepID=Q487T4_COLP3|nr:hypothetical protein CPS_0932 [Colwellia psychrerythraea 34H]